MPRFLYSSLIQAPIEKVFSFHERPDAFDLLAPNFPQITGIEAKGGILVGAKRVFEMRAGPFRTVWVALHTAYERNALFVDEQVTGPFRSWVHRHEFRPEPGGTRLTDSIEFHLPGGVLVDALFGWAVKLALWPGFRQRHEITRRAIDK